MASPLDRGWKTVVCAASGPSLTAEQAEVATAAQTAGRCRIIVVNTTWTLFPGADVLYAADGSWWRLNIEAVHRGFSGELWTQDKPAADMHGLRWVRAGKGDKLPLEPDRICQGSNSGHQAISLAYRFGARRIILIGYDLQRTGGRTHHHGDHPNPLSNGNPTAWLPRFPPLAHDLRTVGVEVVNASLATALVCFPRADLASALQ